MPAAAAAAAEAAPAGGVTAAEDAAGAPRTAPGARARAGRGRRRPRRRPGSGGGVRRWSALTAAGGRSFAVAAAGEFVVVVSGDVVSGERFGFKNLYNHVNLTPLLSSCVVTNKHKSYISKLNHT